MHLAATSESNLTYPLGRQGPVEREIAAVGQLVRGQSEKLQEVDLGSAEPEVAGFRRRLDEDAGGLEGPQVVAKRL